VAPPVGNAFRARIQSDCRSTARGKTATVPNLRPRSVAKPFFATALLLAAAGCMSHQHTVGLGPTGSGETVTRQYYVLFGLIQANDVDPQRLADGLTSYAVDTRFGFVDILLAPLLAPLTLTSRTVTVRT
jgi:hypothetical protein